MLYENYGNLSQLYILLDMHSSLITFNSLEMNNWCRHKYIAMLDFCICLHQFMIFKEIKMQILGESINISFLFLLPFFPLSSVFYFLLLLRISDFGEDFVDSKIAGCD